QRGEMVGRVEGLMNEFMEYGNVSQRSFQRMGKHSLSEELVREVWADYGAQEAISGDKNVENFLKLLKNGGILE
ncbi:MAG: hypothetical protein LBI77_01110, partial [Puniceicoccales bacterium]|nr:hypothetical protein [Puniceicoccales bacterium]